MAEDASQGSGKLEVVLIDKVNLLLRPDILTRIMAKSPLDRTMKSLPSQGLLATSPGTHVPVQIDGEVWTAFRAEGASLSAARLVFNDGFHARGAERAYRSRGDAAAVVLPAFVGLG